MENKINIARFKEGSRTAEVKDIWQWDYGQILRIQGLSLPTAVEIHFSLDEHGGEAVRRIGVTKDGVTDVPIPDSMVENESAYGDSYYFFAYIYLTDETSGNTEYKIRAKVSTRSKPEAFNKPDDEELFRQAIDAVGKSADRAEDAEKSAEAWAHGREDYPDLVDDNAAYYAASAHDSMIETQHLAERVHSDADATARNAALAEQYKSQAAQSAADALQSEQNAKASETAAQEARAGAETAEGQAELFAAQAEEDKNTVEQGKAVVMEIGQKVEDNKKTVEQTVDNFKLLHEQAVADVNNAGQAQTERVNKSGETAVDNIEFSSKQAVQYVANEGTTQVANVQAAAEEIAGKVEQIEKNAQGISELKSEIDQLKQAGTGSGSGVTVAQSNSLWVIIQKAAFAEALTDEELNDFKTAWGITTENIPATGITLDKSTLSFTNSDTQTLIATVEPSNSTDIITWESDNEEIATVTNGVVKPLSNGSATITATCGSVSATCSVTVDIAEEEQVTLTSISATYTGGDVAVGTSLNDLTGITVTAHYSDGSTANVTGYTLSGTIAEGSNTITVSYGGLTTTFDVVGTTSTRTYLEINASASNLHNATAYRDDGETSVTISSGAGYGYVLNQTFDEDIDIHFKITWGESTTWRDLFLASAVPTTPNDSNIYNDIATIYRLTSLKNYYVEGSGTDYTYAGNIYEGVYTLKAGCVLVIGNLNSTTVQYDTENTYFYVEG